METNRRTNRPDPPRDRRQRRSRRRLREAMLALLVAKGYENITIAELAEQALPAQHAQAERHPVQRRRLHQPGTVDGGGQPTHFGDVDAAQGQHHEHRADGDAGDPDQDVARQRGGNHARHGLRAPRGSGTGTTAP